MILAESLASAMAPVRRQIVTEPLNDYAAPEQLSLHRQALYLVFGHASGDTFNAMIHLRTAPPARDYQLIVKRSQLPLVQFLLQLFPRQPTKIHVVDYARDDLAMCIAARHPTLAFARGVAAHADRFGLLDFWHEPACYQNFLPLSDLDIELLVQRFAQFPPQQRLPEDAVLLFPATRPNAAGYVPPWAQVVQTLRELGCQHIYVQQGSSTSAAAARIAGAKPLPSDPVELLRTCYASAGPLRIVAMRSGVVDMLRFCRHRALVLYSERAGADFTSRRLGLLKHCLDLVELVCLDDMQAGQDRLLDYHLRHFLTASLAT